MNTSLSTQLTELVADVLGVAPEAITLDSSPDSVEDWDSVKLLSIAVALEERFGLSLSPEQIESITDVRSILALFPDAPR